MNGIVVILISLSCLILYFLFYVIYQEVEKNHKKRKALKKEILKLKDGNGLNKNSRQNNAENLG